MSALQNRFDDTLSRADALLRERLRREEAELARQDASLEEARRVRAREHAEARRQIAGVYDDAFRSFGTRFLRRSMMKRHRGIAHGCLIGLCVACRKGTNGPAPAPAICRPAPPWTIRGADYRSGEG